MAGFKWPMISHVLFKQKCTHVGCTSKLRAQQPLEETPKDQGQAEIVIDAIRDSESDSASSSSSSSVAPVEGAAPEEDTQNDESPPRYD